MSRDRSLLHKMRPLMSYFLSLVCTLVFSSNCLGKLPKILRKTYQINHIHDNLVTDDNYQVLIYASSARGILARHVSNAAKQHCLTHWGRDQNAAILLTKFPNAYSSVKMVKFNLIESKGSSDNKSSLTQIMAWHRTGDKPFPEPKMTRIPDALSR